MKRKKLIFILTTSLLALMYMGGGTRYFVEFNEMSDIYVALQFPRWLHPVVGVTKFMAVISLITILFNIKFNPSWLKEWTYAGIFFNATLALMAHQMVNEPFVLSIPAVMVLLLVIISRYTWDKKNLTD